MRAADVQTNRKSFRIPGTVTLRECSVVIIGSTCRICGRAFKCESDVNLHARWRHNAGLGSLLEMLGGDKNFGNVEQKCDVCDMFFGAVADLRSHKRLIHRHLVPRLKGRRRKELVRVRFKLNGVTTTDVILDRRYIKLQNGDTGCTVDVCTQTAASLENERAERKDDRAGNIDLPFPNRAVDKSHMQYDSTQLDKAANRYTVGKFASTKGDAIASRVTTGGKSLAEISNTSHKDTDASDDFCEGHKDRCYLATQETTTNVFIKSLADSKDIRDKDDSPRVNEREGRSVQCQNEIPFDHNKFRLAYQLEKSDKALPIKMFKENPWPSENPYYPIRWSDEVAGTQKTAGLASSFINSMDIINNGKSFGFNGDATKRRQPLSPLLSRLYGKTESTKAKSNVDDDVQEVLRITRGNAQNDINHESPNRMEREMLVQNTIGDTFTLPPQLEPIIYPEKCGDAFSNFEPFDYSSFVTMTEREYQEILENSFNKKLGIYLEGLHHYGIRLYNELPEINNNSLEDYAVYAHQNFFEPWKQSDEPSSNELKANDNEVAVVLD